jgi:tetratricopeptide (TPR) repeat protein
MKFQRDHYRRIPDWRRLVQEAEDPGRRGDLLRAHPRHVESAVRLLRLSHRRARTPRERAVAQIRLATALQYAGRHDLALRWFGRADRTIAEARLRNLRHYLEQHRGKCLVEMGRLEEARAAFRVALRLRRNRPELLVSTRRALAAIEPRN